MNRLLVRTKNNKGSTLIIVLVIVAFIAILGTTTIASAFLNYKMKLVDKQSKKSFYTAEEAVDQVYAGLGKLCMENLNLVYTDKMATITRQDASTGSSYQISNDDCNRELRVEFMDKMLKALFQTYTWDKSNTSAVIPPTTETAIGAKTVVQILNSYIEDTAKLRVKSVGKQKLEVEASMYPNMYNYTIVIKDCAIEYKNEDGYFANVTVDINIGLPDLKIVFIDDSESQLTTFEDFAIIANTGLNVNSSKTFNISDTKVYAGVTGGIKVGSNAAFNAQGKSSVVTPGALNVGADLSNTPGAVAKSTNSKFSLATNSKLWCMDIITPDNSSLGTISISGSAFVKDDLNVDGDNNIAVIDGNYIGFSYEGRITSTVVGHANSSAMMINGKGCRLSMNAITTLILGGRSYIDIAGQHSYMTGESVSLRANQEIYLVPDAFLKKKDGSGYYSNPVVSTYKDQVEVTVPDSFFAKGWLTTQKVTTVTQNGFVYYYFDIKKEYVDDYVNAIANYDPAKDSLDIYRQALKKLLMADITELQQQSLITNGSGAAIYSNGSLINAQLDVSGKIDSVSAQTTGSEFGLGADSFKITATDLNNRFSLITKVLYEPSFYSDGSDVKGNEALTSKERAIYTSYPSTIIVNGKKINISDKTDNVFTNFINTTYLYEKTNIKDYTPAGQTDSSPFKVYVSNKTRNGGTIYIDNVGGAGHINYTDGLIITDGNVVVRQNFNGLIIAGGTVSVDNSVTVTNTYKTMDNMLASLSADDRTAVQKFFTAWSGKDVEKPKDPLEYNISGITYKNIVDFNNWRKSAPTVIEVESSTSV